MKKIKISTSGYKAWKCVKNNLDMFHFYVLPSIIIHQDRTFDIDEYPTEIKFAWLFWDISIYLCI